MLACMLLAVNVVRQKRSRYGPNLEVLVLLSAYASQAWSWYYCKKRWYSAFGAISSL